jgi:hypothetical protein
VVSVQQDKRREKKMTVQHINNEHPAAKAARITSDAMRLVYFATRAQVTGMRTSQKARREAIAALNLSERVHNRVTETLKATQSAWFSQEVA